MMSRERLVRSGDNLVSTTSPTTAYHSPPTTDHHPSEEVVDRDEKAEEKGEEGGVVGGIMMLVMGHCDDVYDVDDGEAGDGNEDTDDEPSSRRALPSLHWQQAAQARPPPWQGFWQRLPPVHADDGDHGYNQDEEDDNNDNEDLEVVTIVINISFINPPKHMTVPYLN